MQSTQISELLKRLKPDQLKSIVRKCTNDISQNIIQKIEANVPIKVGNRITLNDSTVTLSGTKIPIEDFNPTLLKFSATRGSVAADFSMWKGEQLLAKAFWNPKADKIRTRKGQKAYPIAKIYGPSIKDLFMQRHSSFTEENNKIMFDNFKILGL